MLPSVFRNSSLCETRYRHRGAAAAAFVQSHEGGGGGPGAAAGAAPSLVKANRGSAAMLDPHKEVIALEDVTKVFYTDELETHALSGIHLTIYKGEDPTSRIRGPRPPEPAHHPGRRRAGGPVDGDLPAVQAEARRGTHPERDRHVAGNDVHRRVRTPAGPASGESGQRTRKAGVEWPERRRQAAGCHESRGRGAREREDAWHRDHRPDAAP